VREIFDQARLADASLATEHDHPWQPGPRIVEPLPEQVQLALPTDEDGTP
jgi:hypothetical protein